TDAYEEFGVSAGGRISRRFNRHLSGSLGTALTLTRITEDNALVDDDNLYGLVSFPATLSFDNRDNKLDPSRGWMATGSVKPFVDVLGASDPFVKAQASAGTYYAFDRDDN